MKSLIVHYQEIALKGKNRPWFITRLVHNLRAATRGVGVREVRPLMGRIEIVLDPDAEWERVRDRLSRVFGVANFARAGRTPLDIDAIAESILRDLGPDNPASFRVSVRRADEALPADLSGDRAGGRRPHQDGARLASIWEVRR
jgi:thiamine biosynthesis protein ThiI